MTFSIVASDPDNGELGIAVATRWPSVGSLVPWLEPGVGAVATQSFTNVELGPRGLALLRAGRPASDVLRELIADDPGAETRQLGLVDGNGGSAAHTGARCVGEAGHVCAPGVSVQANMLEQGEVWRTMLDAFEHAEGELAERLLSALRAAEREGGDIRGSQSAALLVAPGDTDAQPWARRFDLRVDDSDRPVDELARLLHIARAYEALEAALTAAKNGEFKTALAGTTEAQRLAPEDAQISYWHAQVLEASGRRDEARLVLDAALLAEPRLAEYGRRYAAAGHSPLLDADLDGLAPPTTGAASDTD